MSIWSDLDYKKYENPFYQNKDSTKYITEIIPNYGYNKLRVWNEYFFRWNKINVFSMASGDGTCILSKIIFIFVFN